MKGYKLILAVCLATLGFGGAIADDAADTARAAVRRTTTQTSATTSARTKTSENTRGGATQQSSQKSVSNRERSTVSSRNSTSTNRDSGTSAGVSARPATNVMTRNTPQNNVAPRTTQSRTVSRTGSTPMAVSARTTATTTPNSSRAAAAIARSATATKPAHQSGIKSASRVRAADVSGAKISAADIIARDSSKCRQVYYDCMDEFCANKDAQLKRCACSSRVNEFDRVKQQLSNVEDKMLSFNQRLLTVNMDAEDAAALNIATEGELAFQQKDKSKSKKMLDDIAKKLNTTFNDSGFEQSMNAMSLSFDSAFDTVDSLAGVGTTTKSGVALYNAALPVCREMAAEVCSDDELDIIASGYQMSIEQDCNLVAKSYQSQTAAARDKVRESSALLDMARLDIYQQRNSDDILTCRKKMLDMLTDATVCGDEMGKCLDTTGQYIDPSTGQAFLTQNLANLSTLITRPESSEKKWTSIPNNQTFVDFLTTKKKYITAATENCQAIADTIWDDFIEDALAQIKLAQESKLETVRQSCTTLTTQCLSDAAKSLADFDARALSTFGVVADLTVNQMCANVRNACTALLDTDENTKDWSTGMAGIETAKTYETMMQTCREVGRACIIQVCKSVSGNFGLCEDINNSINRKSIVSRRACWSDVENCVKSVGTEKIDQIIEQLTNDGAYNEDENNSNNFYASLYGGNFAITNPKQRGAEPSACTATNDSDPLNIYDLCNQYEKGTNKYKVCRLTEKIWGNCEFEPTTNLSYNAACHNKIQSPKDGTETLLSWFAKNTGTTDDTGSCRDTSCPAGFGFDTNGTCVDNRLLDSFGHKCDTDKDNEPIKLSYDTENKVSECCYGDLLQESGQKYMCSAPGGKNNINLKNLHSFTNSYYYGTPQNSDLGALSLAAPAGMLVTEYAQDKYLACIGDSISAPDPKGDSFPKGQTLLCNGRWVIITIDNNIAHMEYATGTNDLKHALEHTYVNDKNDGWIWKDGTWTKADDPNSTPSTAPTKWYRNWNGLNVSPSEPSTGD